MATQQLAPADPLAARSRALFARMAEGYAPRDFAVRFWDGSVWGPEAGHEARFTFVLNHPGAMRRMFLDLGGLAFGEAFLHGDFDVEGDGIALARFTRHLVDRKFSAWEKLSLAWGLYSLPAQARPATGTPARVRGARHSPERDKQAISYTYDLPPEFYALWLDQAHQYTCGFYRTPDDTLDQAQAQKMDLICRKLRLKPGERLLDIGGGWGGLAMFAARNYGVEAVGTTISGRQLEFANARIKAAGLEGRCRVEFRDYRDPQGKECFDKMTCICVLEHVEGVMMPTFFRAAHTLLKPGGLFLNQGITRLATQPLPQWTPFVHKYIFPDGGLEPVTTTLRHAEEAGFEVRDVESLREHYVLTLTHWLRRLEARHEEAVRLVGEATYRAFWLYLGGAQNGFLRGSYNVYQTLFAKPDGGKSGLPLTRADWYG